MKTEHESLFSDAFDHLNVALQRHYSSGDYARLGMALQDVEKEVLAALQLAAAFDTAQTLIDAAKESE